MKEAAMKDSEKRLAVFAFLILAVIGGLILSKRFLTWQHGLERNETALTDELAYAQTLLQEKPLWDAREAWLAKTQPVAKSDSDADTESFNQLVAKAEKAGLTVENRQYLEPVKNEFYHQFVDAFTVKGSLPDVFRWIYSVQSPSEFRVVPKIKITPDKDDPNKVVCAIQFWRWYQPSAPQGA
jgi:hypothetical protein